MDRWAPGRVMLNAYGETETWYASFSAPLAAGSGTPPIGSPVPGRRCLCWIAGCARCRPAWWASCTWLVAGWRADIGADPR
ncbi:putative PEPTIDE SYNTHETASE NRP domain protein [Mycobacterium xenopi 3993]|nr:putative PEPTIDE SYNTHETASE NRP domain protein [Mycobacterium xenopi 3993]